MGNGNARAFRGTAAALAVLSASLLLPAGCRAKAPPRPNIVLVVWDTCRGDRVSVNGYRRSTTPRLAELAARGVTFRNCSTPSPLTPPAHASLFTGLLPRRHGLREEKAPHIQPGIPLLAETLRAAGYETAAFSANPTLSEVTSLLVGFDRAEVVVKREVGKGDADEVVARVRGWLRDRGGRAAGSGPRQPVFLFVNLMETHVPLRFRREDAVAFRGFAEGGGALREAAGLDVMATLGHLLGVRPVPAERLRGLGDAYDASVLSSDRATDEILADLGRAGLIEDALVVVTGDHGENLGEHGELEHRMSVYEPVLHVPLVVSRPGSFEGGRVEDARVRLQDLYPTILEAAGVPVPAPCGADAVSLAERPLKSRPVLAEYGPMASFLPDMAGIFPEARNEHLRRLRLAWLAARDPSVGDGARKYIAVTYHPEKGAPVLEREELYDLAADPGEERNLLGPGGPPDARADADRLRALVR